MTEETGTDTGEASWRARSACYLNEFLDNLFGFTIPDSISKAPEADGVTSERAV